MNRFDNLLLALAPGEPLGISLRMAGFFASLLSVALGQSP